MEVEEVTNKTMVSKEVGDNMNGAEKADGNGKDGTESSSNSKVVSADQDILYVQDVGFNVKVSVPGLDQFTIQVSAMELVQEIHQLLMDREDTWRGELLFCDFYRRGSCSGARACVCSVRGWRQRTRFGHVAHARVANFKLQGRPRRRIISRHRGRLAPAD